MNGWLIQFFAHPPSLSLAPTCTQLVLCEKGKFALDGEFSKNAPYKQKIIFHLTSIGKMSRKNFFLPWTVGRWYGLYGIEHLWIFGNKGKQKHREQIFIRPT